MAGPTPSRRSAPLPPTPSFALSFKGMAGAEGMPDLNVTPSELTHLIEAGHVEVRAKVIRPVIISDLHELAIR